MFHRSICENSLRCEKCNRIESRHNTVKKIARKSAMPIAVGVASSIPFATLAVLASRNND